MVNGVAAHGAVEHVDDEETVDDEAVDPTISLAVVRAIVVGRLTSDDSSL